MLAFEDLHWTDPTTLDAAARLSRNAARLAPLLVVATTRPEFRAPWGAALASRRRSRSAPLDRGQVRQMVGELAERHALSNEVIEGVGERTGGVPLFVEEVTRLLLERGEQGGAQAIPPTLAAIACRAARPARSGARGREIGAVLGRELSPMRSCAPSREIDDRAAAAGAGRLAEADILLSSRACRHEAELSLQARADPGRGLRKPAQEPPTGAASPRRGTPARSAGARRGRARSRSRITSRRRGVDDLAIEWWGKAGDQALRRSAFQEAIAHLGKAIEMADQAGGEMAGAA